MSENETWGMEDKKGACISLFFMGGNKKRLTWPDARSSSALSGLLPGLDNSMENNYICTVFSKSFVIKSILYHQNAIAVKKSKACGRK